MYFPDCVGTEQDFVYGFDQNLKYDLDGWNDQYIYKLFDFNISPDVQGGHLMIYATRRKLLMDNTFP